MSKVQEHSTKEEQEVAEQAETENDLMVELAKVSKRYALGGEIVAALESIDLEIQRGEYVSIMGSSGSGKSTLLQILGALDQPTEGQYFLEGHDITVLPDAELARIRNCHFGFVFQAYNLFPELTAAENVMLPLNYSKVSLRDQRERAMRQLEAVGLTDRAGHTPAQLSGGQQQRVAIARALVTEPSLILADEPTGNLNQEGASGILSIFDQLQAEGTGLIVVTHDPAVGQRASRMVTLEDGKIVSDE